VNLYVNHINIAIPNCLIQFYGGQLHKLNNSKSPQADQLDLKQAVCLDKSMGGSLNDGFPQQTHGFFLLQNDHF